MFDAILVLFARGEPADLVSVLAQMRRAGTLPSTDDRGPGN